MDQGDFLMGVHDAGVDCRVKVVSFSINKGGASKKRERETYREVVVEGDVVIYETTYLYIL